jgi:flagellar protein FliO/FliZ
MNASFTPPVPVGISAGSILQVILSLGLVLAAVALVSWIMKRSSLVPKNTGNPIRVLQGIAVGQRERIVLVEVGENWLVVGVAPGQIRTLHTLPKGTLPPPSQSQDGSDGKFQTWLKHVMERRNAP